MAKAITAFQTRERIERIIQVYGLVRFSEKTIVDRLDLLNEYEKIRQNGWSMEREESAVGICCFGAPVFNEKQHAVAAISVMCPLLRITPERETVIIKELLKTSQEASLHFERNHPWKSDCTAQSSSPMIIRRPTRSAAKQHNE